MMDDGIQKFLVSISSTGVGGLILWVWALWRDHTALAQKVGEHYTKRTDLAEAQGKVEKRLERIEYLVGQLCLKLEVPVATDPFR